MIRRLWRFYMSWPTLKPKGGPAWVWMVAGAILAWVARLAWGEF